jgi:hypothetical protein
VGEHKKGVVMTGSENEAAFQIFETPFPIFEAPFRFFQHKPEKLLVFSCFLCGQSDFYSYLCPHSDKKL